MGAFLEAFRGMRRVARRDIGVRRLAALRVPGGVMLADCTAERAAGFGVTAAIHSSENYRLTQEWALAFARFNFDGVAYLLSHDPSQRCLGVALFGDAGIRRQWPVHSMDRIGEELIREAWARFDILVLPTPG